MSARKARPRPAKKTARKPTKKPKSPAKAAAPTGADWRDQLAEEVMQSDVVTVEASAPLSEVERLLAEHRIGGAPVVDEAGHIVGVLSVRDLVDRYAQDPDSRPRRSTGFYRIDAEEMEDEDVETFELPEEGEETAGQVMNRQVLAVPPDATLREVAKKMVKENVHRLLVQNGPRTVGIISTMDLLRAAAR